MPAPKLSANKTPTKFPSILPNTLQNTANRKALDAVGVAVQAVKRAEEVAAVVPVTQVPPSFGQDVAGVNMTQAQAARFIEEKRAYYQRAQVNMPLLGYVPTPVKDDPSTPFPFGFPPPVGTVFHVGEVPWNNDACTILYDERTGLYWSWSLYRIHANQMAPWASNGWASFVSLDGLHPAQVNALGVDGASVASTQYTSGGGVILDRDNRNGLGAGAALFVIGMGDGTWQGADIGSSMFLFSATGGLWDTVQPVGVIAPQGPTNGDPRPVWDNVNQQYVVVARSDVSANDCRLSFHTGPTLQQLALQSLWIPDTVQALSKVRTECPNMNFMIDEVTGARVCVLSYAQQVYAVNEYDEAVVIEWDGKTPSTTKTPKRLSYGADQYGVTINDPFQRDGSGTTSDGSLECWVHRWAYDWVYCFSDNGWNGGYSGNWAPSILKLRNGELFELPHPGLYNDFTGPSVFSFPNGVSGGASPSYIPLTLGRFWRMRLVAPVCLGVGSLSLQFGGANQRLDILIDCVKGKNIQVDRQHLGNVTLPNAPVPMPIADVTQPIELFLYWDTCRLMLHNITDGTSLGTVAFPPAGNTTVTGLAFTGALFGNGLLLEVDA